MDRWNHDRIPPGGNSPPGPVASFLSLLIAIPTVLSLVAALGFFGVLTLISVFGSVSPYLGASICIATIVASGAFLWSLDFEPRAGV